MLRVIDTETCGLQGGIVEIASVDIVDGQITNPMSHLVRPDRPISPPGDGYPPDHGRDGRR